MEERVRRGEQRWGGERHYGSLKTPSQTRLETLGWQWRAADGSKTGSRALWRRAAEQRGAMDDGRRSVWVDGRRGAAAAAAAA